MATAVQGIDDLLDQLDATTARGRKDNAIRATNGPRIPYMHHMTELEWRPLPKLDAVRHTLKPGASRKWVNYTQNNGSALSEPGYMRPKVQTVWQRERNTQPERNYTSNHAHPPRYHSQPELLPETSDEMLAKQHKDWMPGHYAERTAKIYPIVHAMDKVDRAQAGVDALKAMKEKTTDLITRGTPPDGHSPKISPKARSGLNKAMVSVKTKRAFDKLHDQDALDYEVKEAEKKLIKAKSVPILRFHHPPPPGCVEHLRKFQNPDMGKPKGSLRQTTPWIHYDEVEDLKNLGRKTW